MNKILNRSIKKVTAASVAITFAFAAGAVQAQTKLTVQGGAPVPTYTLLGLYVGQQLGYFKAEGIDLEIRNTANASTAVQLMASNNADIALATVEPLLLGQENGVKAKAFLLNHKTLMYNIAVPKGSNITSPANLKGVKIGVSNLGSASLTVAKSILLSAGVTPTADTFVPVGVGDQALTALRSGKVQALAMWDVMYAAMERNGQQFTYFNHPTLGTFGNLASMASDATIATKQKALCGYGRALAKSSLFAAENPEAALQLYWDFNPAARVPANNPEEIKKAVAELKYIADIFNVGFGPGEKYGVIDEEKFKQYAELLYKDKGTPEKTPAVSSVATSALTACINEFDRAAVRKAAKEWKK
ncbi:NitT/TauT family transport system substrate-binding protein [Paucimonas lemoignei]|uniref:NitT/TauT family transport system substrate-binding protein n=1 Tax=Paucimonas lemoignei TaxID=29443 RepID=A0A4R3HUR7_PAULE|nr:ABC transporter substrate-binding protein [Paucimonas lemoignei]TCS33757.1 NitT/TauT family transport system substrate-binding protein [Paucimonas lemoignei]